MIGAKWVLRNKLHEHGVVGKKVRLVVKEFCEEKGIHYNKKFVRVAKLEAIWMFLIFVAHSKLKFKVYQIDAKSAFFNKNIEE